MQPRLLSRATFLLLPIVAAAISLAALATGCGNTPSGTDNTVDPTFSSIQEKVFKQSCSSSSCHSTLGGRGGLVLDSTTTYENLVNCVCSNTAAINAGLKRVVPGQPDSSFLMIKLTGPGIDEGEPMPYSNGKLNQQALDAIRTWIANGAPRN
jgi:hypothetical protein